jgi:hypothetical protein
MNKSVSGTYAYFGGIFILGTIKKEVSGHNLKILYLNAFQLYVWPALA